MTGEMITLLSALSVATITGFFTVLNTALVKKGTRMNSQDHGVVADKITELEDSVQTVLSNSLRNTDLIKDSADSVVEIVNKIDRHIEWHMDHMP